MVILRQMQCVKWLGLRVALGTESLHPEYIGVVGLRSESMEVYFFLDGRIEVPRGYLWSAGIWRYIQRRSRCSGQSPSSRSIDAFRRESCKGIREWTRETVKWTYCPTPRLPIFSSQAYGTNVTAFNNQPSVSAVGQTPKHTRPHIKP